MHSSSNREISKNKSCEQKWRWNPAGWKRALLAAVLTTLSMVACCGSGNSYLPPPPPAPQEWFFVGNFSGNVSGFSAASGQLAPLPGSSVMLPFALTIFAVKPDGTFLAAITITPQLAQSFPIANIASGGAISLQPLTSVSTTPGGMAISS